MPAFSQEELDEILGTGYASRVLASQVLCPTSTATTSARIANQPTPSPHTPTALLIPYVQNDELHMPPAGVINSSHSFLEHPESQIDSPGLVPKPGKNHSVHRAVSALNGLLQMSPAQKDLTDRTLNAKSKVKAVHSSGPKQVSRTELGRDGKLKTNSILHSRTSNRNARSSSANGRNLIKQDQTVSRILGPRQPSASLRASHKPRVSAFNRPRNPHADTFNAQDSDRDQRSLIAASRSFAVVIRTPPTSADDSQLLALSYNEPVPRNRWTEEQRWTLAFMRRTFDNDLGEQLKIFNTMFADDLMACGLRNGISSPSTIESQWRDMKAGKEGYKYWTFFNINFAHWDRTLTDLQERIQEAARRNKIILDIRLVQERNILKHGNRQKGVKNATYPHGLKPYPKSLSDKDSAMLPKKARSKIIGGPGMVPPAAYCPALPETASLFSQASIEDTEDPAPTRGHDQKKSNIPPKLTYRFFNISSAGCNGRTFICGALTEGAAMPPRDPDSEEFKAAFTRHMEPDQTLASPFISTFASCLPPIHRAMIKKNAACIAVIDLAGVIHDSKEANGDVSQSVFSAGDLVSKYGLSLRGNYTAETEYHVYGMIPSKHVVCIFSTDRLWDITKASPEINAMLHLPRLASTTPRGLNSFKRWLKRNSVPYNRDTGSIVGELLRLLGAPDGILLDLSMKIAEVWRFKGYIRHSEEFLSEADREYITGVKSGHKSEQNGEYEDMHTALTTQFTAMIPSSQETRRTGKAFLEDDEVDLFNPYDVDMDGAASDASQSVHMKVEPWLAGLQDAAREIEDDDRMDVDQLDEPDEIWGRGRGRGRGRGGNGDGDREPEQLSPLQRMAAKKGLKFNKPPKWMFGRD